MSIPSPWFEPTILSLGEQSDNLLVSEILNTVKHYWGSKELLFIWVTSTSMYWEIFRVFFIFISWQIYCIIIKWYFHEKEPVFYKLNLQGEQTCFRFLKLSLMSGSIRRQLDFHVCFCMQSAVISHVRQPLEYATACSWAKTEKRKGD